MPQNSLPAPSLPEQPLSVANESCSGCKKQQKTVPHPLPLINKLISSLDLKPANESGRTLPSEMVAKLPLVSIWEGQMAISFYGGKNECYKNVLNNFHMSKQYWGCLDKIRSKFQSSWNPALSVKLLLFFSQSQKTLEKIMDAQDDNAIKMLPFSRGQNPFLDRERCLLCNCERTDAAEPESISPGKLSLSTVWLLYDMLGYIHVFVTPVH